MSNRKSLRKTVGSAFNTSIESGIKRRKNASKLIVKYKPVNQRQFYHSQTNQAFTTEENAHMVDSEDEFQLLDIQRHHKIINENRHLSTDQKKIMNLWNQFVENHIKFGIKHLKTMCNVFIDTHIDDIRQQKLYHDFVLHLCTLYHGNLLVRKDFFSVVNHLHVHMGIQEKSLASVMNQTNHHHRQSNGKENHVNRKRKRSSTLSADHLDQPKQKQQRYSLRACNSITTHG